MVYQLVLLIELRELLVGVAELQVSLIDLHVFLLHLVALSVGEHEQGHGYDEENYNNVERYVNQALLLVKLREIEPVGVFHVVNDPLARDAAKLGVGIISILHIFS